MLRLICVQRSTNQVQDTLRSRPILLALGEEQETFAGLRRVSGIVVLVFCLFGFEIVGNCAFFEGVIAKPEVLGRETKLTVSNTVKSCSSKVSMARLEVG